MPDRVHRERVGAYLRSWYRRRLQAVPGWAFPPAAGHRLLSDFIPGVWAEWSLLYPSRHDSSGSSPELVRLLCEAAGRALDIALTDVSARARGVWEPDDVETWPGEHYRLLAALAEVRHARSVVEVGTFTGASALAFLAAEAVERLVTYDLVAWNDHGATMLRAEDFGPRLEQRLVNLGDEAVFAAEAETLRTADLVFVDGPKDGDFEYRFLPWLLGLEPARQQLVVLDDVRVMPMVKLWRDIPLPKLDAASLGHWSGTGLILRDGPVAWTPPTSGLAGKRSRARAGDATAAP